MKKALVPIVLFLSGSVLIFMAMWSRLGHIHVNEQVFLISGTTATLAAMVVTVGLLTKRKN